MIRSLECLQAKWQQEDPYPRAGEWRARGKTARGKGLVWVLEVYLETITPA